MHLLTLTLLACDGVEAPADDADGDAGAEAGVGECAAEVRIGVYESDDCAGEPRMVQTLTISEACVAWSHGERENSATRFQCWRDRLCYTQYVASGTCDPDAAILFTDKEARTSCQKDPTPKIYTKILGGTEACPEPPPGFECPISAADAGTPGVAAACEG